MTQPTGLQRSTVTGHFLATGVVRVPFTTGAGTGFTLVDVAYIADFPRGDDGSCAFCHGDPCAEFSLPDAPISTYRAQRGKRFETCPMCNGRPS